MYPFFYHRYRDHYRNRNALKPGYDYDPDPDSDFDKTFFINNYRLNNTVR